MRDVKEWQWYEEGKNYNRRLEPNFYNLVDCNWDFFYGNQWRNAGLNDELPKPVFNNINRFVTFFVASILANKTKVMFDSPIKANEDDNTDDVVNQSWKEFEERVKLEWNTKQALYDGAVTGDFIGHLMLNPDAKPYNGAFSDVVGEIDFELVDANNFYMSNPNINDVQKQSYIQIAGRDLVKNLKKEAEEQQEIQADNDTEEQASRYGQIEMESGEATEKATYVITYEKREVEEEYEDSGNDYEEDKPKKKKTRKCKRVFASKCTSGGYIYKDVDLGISRYPVALGNWEIQRNTFHGMSFVRAAIPTQIFINRAFALAMFNTTTTSMPKLVFNSKKISGFSNRVGGQIGVDLRDGETLSNVAQYLAPGNMSGQVMPMIELAQSFMQQTVGANDALLGNVNPEQASGVSIAVTSKQAGIPLENPKSNMYNWLEDIALIYLDMISNLYGERPVIMPTDEGMELVEFDFDKLKDTYQKATVNVGPSTYWSALAVKDTYDNLLVNQYIDFLTYLESVSEEFIPNKDELIKKIKDAQEEQSQQVGPEQEFLQTLTPEEQQEFLAMPEAEQQAIYQKAMQG